MVDGAVRRPFVDNLGVGGDPLVVEADENDMLLRQVLQRGKDVLVEVLGSEELLPVVGENHLGLDDIRGGRAFRFGDERLHMLGKTPQPLFERSQVLREACP